MKGPFSLGKWYMPIGIIACAWVCFIVVLLLFPPGQTTTAQTMSASLSVISLSCLPEGLIDDDTDYAVVIIMAVFIFASASWVISAHKWFTGPIRNVDSSGTTSYDEKQQET